MFYYIFYHHLPYQSTMTLFHKPKPKTKTNLNPNAKPFFSTTTSISKAHPEPEPETKSSLSPTFWLPHNFLPPYPTKQKKNSSMNPETAKVIDNLARAPGQACPRVVVKKWVRRGTMIPNNKSEDVPVNLGRKTTVMIKNIPNKFLRADLVDMLDSHCRLENEKALKAHPHDHDLVKSQFDFLYLPIDFKNRANKGYAFVNMTSSEGAMRLCRAFNNFKWEVHKSNKICQVTIARIQGRDALKKRFKNTVFKCDSDEYLPLVFSPPRDGASEPTSPPLLAGTRRPAP